MEAKPHTESKSMSLPQNASLPYIDNVGTEWITELVNNKGELERTFGSEYGRRMMWTGRLYSDP